MKRERYFVPLVSGKPAVIECGTVYFILPTVEFQTKNAPRLL